MTNQLPYEVLLRKVVSRVNETNAVIDANEYILEKKSWKEMKRTKADVMETIAMQKGFRLGLIQQFADSQNIFYVDAVHLINGIILENKNRQREEELKAI